MEDRAGKASRVADRIHSSCCCPTAVDYTPTLSNSDSNLVLWYPFNEAEGSTTATVSTPRYQKQADF